MNLPGTEPPLVVAIAFHDTATMTGMKVQVGTLVIDEAGRASIMDANGQADTDAIAGVLRLCETLREQVADKSEGERVMAAMAHALVRMLSLPVDQVH